MTLKIGVGLRVLDHLALEIGRRWNGRADGWFGRRRHDAERCDGGRFSSLLCHSTNQPVISFTLCRFPS
jgi:hypothetical protein